MTTRRRALLAVTIAALFSALLVVHTEAHEPHPGLQFSIGVRGVPGCNTRASNVTCTLPSGRPFVLEVSLDALPDDIPTYEGFDIYLKYAGVTPQHDASTDDWPDCGFPASSYDQPGVVDFGCARGLPPAGPSSYIGPIGTNTFTCGQNGSITLQHSAARGYTDLVQGVLPGPTPGVGIGNNHAEGAGTTETITISCFAATPTRTLPSTLTAIPASTPAPVLPSTGQHAVGATRVPLAPIAALLVGSAGLLACAALLRWWTRKNRTASR